MVRQLSHSAVGDILAEEGGRLPYDGRQVPLHLLECEEEDVVLGPPPPVLEHVRDEGAVVPGNISNECIEKDVEGS